MERKLPLSGYTKCDVLRIKQPYESRMLQEREGKGGRERSNHERVACDGSPGIGESCAGKLKVAKMAGEHDRD